MPEIQLSKDKVKQSLAKSATLPETEIATASIRHDSLESAVVLLAGEPVPHDKTIKLKSNRKSKPLDQIWVGRTSRWSLGSNKDGAFSSTECEFTPEDIKKYENDGKRQAGLWKLVWLCGELKKTVKAKAGRSSNGEA
ncbi:hypothetical protein G6011_00290 [Alternaria panax]|uniref:Uncharacterized protein n=1 Tax=Alternaria panax TaxID=48097 RepID=A0AAD4IIL5_9PLEO|nr:hypothetical protein G6011_00290 [Alternaria panax]